MYLNGKGSEEQTHTITPRSPPPRPSTPGPEPPATGRIFGARTEAIRPVAGGSGSGVKAHHTGRIP